MKHTYRANVQNISNKLYFVKNVITANPAGQEAEKMTENNPYSTGLY
jgi:hypothetical protein